MKSARGGMQEINVKSFCTGKSDQKKLQKIFAERLGVSY